MDLGQRLRTLRQGRKYSLHEVGQKVGLHFSTIAKYERNERQPHIDVLRDLAALYGVPAAALISDADDLRDFLTEEQVEWLTLLDSRPRLGPILQQLARLSDGQLDGLAAFLGPVSKNDGGQDLKGQGAAKKKKASKDGGLKTTDESPGGGLVYK